MPIIISAFLLVFIILSIILFINNRKLCKRIEKHEKIEIELYDEIETLNRIKNRLKKEIKEIKEINENTEKNVDSKKYSGKKVIVGNHLKSGALITQKLLQNIGFSVEIVQDPQDIIDNIKTGEHYDAIITNNLYHFGKTGEELLHTLRNITGFQTPVIVHTIDKDKENYYVEQIGFDGYLEKPLKLEAVIKVMDQLLN